MVGHGLGAGGGRLHYLQGGRVVAGLCCVLVCSRYH